MTDFAHARKTMVDNQLRTSAITDRRLLIAMGEVPRELFVPAARRPLAYIDDAHPIGAGRRLGPPAPFAKLVQLAAIRHTDRVLDVGCGTGYSAVVLGRIAGTVVAVEDDAALAGEARANVSAAGASNVSVINGTLASSVAAQGPYDVVVIEGTVAEVPEALLSQLRPDGRLVALIAGPGRTAVAHLFARSGETIAASSAFDATLPPLQQPADPGFVF